MQAKMRKECSLFPAVIVISCALGFCYKGALGSSQTKNEIDGSNAFSKSCGRFQVSDFVSQLQPAVGQDEIRDIECSAQQSGYIVDGVTHIGSPFVCGRLTVQGYRAAHAYQRAFFVYVRESPYLSFSVIVDHEHSRIAARLCGLPIQTGNGETRFSRKSDVFLLINDSHHTLEDAAFTFQGSTAAVHHALDLAIGKTARLAISDSGCLTQISVLLKGVQLPSYLYVINGCDFRTISVGEHSVSLKP